MKYNKTFLVLFIIIVVSSLAAVNSESKLSYDLQQYLAENDDPDEHIPLFVILNEQYNTQKLYNEVKDMPKHQRREYTIKTLKEFSEVNQKELKILLSLLEEEGRIVNLRYLWITNVIGIQAKQNIIEYLALHPSIDSIQLDYPRYALSSANYKTTTSQYNRTRNSFKRDNKTYYRNVADNIAHIDVPSVWEEGYKGEGVVVSVIDTGVNYYHHDIKNQMWEHPEFSNHGFNFVHNNYNPRDDNGHGSHCAGTIAGNGTVRTITGVAPESTIMAVKVLDDRGIGQMHHYWEAVQYSIEYGADILSVSLGWRNESNANRREMRRVKENTLNAGVVAAICAGNESDSGIRTPGDCPPPWLHPNQTYIGGISAAVTVGATTLTNEIASFSSLGPVTWQTVEPYVDYPSNPGIGLIKPDICAPGVDVLSIVHSNNIGYVEMSGTSMSTPTVAGVMALMLSRSPILTPEEVSQILEETALPLSSLKNNTFGSGLVNPIEAVSSSHIIDIAEVSYCDDNNNIPEYGENINITISLFNSGISYAQNVVGTIISNDPYIRIINDTASYGNIEIGSSVTVDDGYLIEIADNIPDLHKVRFDLQISLENGMSWKDAFYMEVRAPNLVSDEIYLFDYLPDGNNNGFIDPGEEVTVYIPIRNIGGALSPPIQIDINTESTFAEINEISETNFSSLVNGETIYPFIRISVSENAENQSIVLFSYSYEAGNYVFEGEFTADIGQVKSFRLGTCESFNQNNEPCPINISHKSLRSQTVYTAEELNKLGVFGQKSLVGLGYYIISPPEYSLPDFLIRMKHTNLSESSEHIQGPYVSVFRSDSYTPIDYGWDFLSFDTAFNWNGVDNILIDTAFSPTQDWSYSGQVKIIESKKGLRYTRADNVDQTNAITLSTVDYKPQLLLMFELDNESEYRPKNLTGEIENEFIHLSWQSPNVSTLTEQHSIKNSRHFYNDMNGRGLSEANRNPIKYNIYRNGLLIESDYYETDYFDNIEHISKKGNYYFVTALYENRESQPSNIIDIMLKVADPAFSVEEQIHYEHFILHIVSDTENVDIYYTFNGIEPTTSDFLYTEPIRIVTSTMITAKAFKNNWQDSDSVTSEYYVLYSPIDLKAELLDGSVLLSWENPDIRKRYYKRDNKQSFERNQRMRKHSDNIDSIRNSIIWSNNEYTNLVGYNVYRSKDNQNYISLNQKLLTDKFFLDDNINEEVYYYYVTAQYEQGESQPSNMVVINYTSADEIYEEQLATKLYAAYPNPFNPYTEIKFSLKKNDYVKIDVYNVKGQKINTLLSAYLDAGEYSTIWEGYDFSGIQVSSGIYFYQMTSSDYRKWRKIILLK